jgi:hypothetical protein
MINKIDIPDYIEILKTALEKVPSIYFSIKRNLDGMLNNIKDEKVKKEIEKLSLKYQERTFCYELYHQLRLLQDEEDGPFNEKDILIHAEIRKDSLLTEVYKEWKMEELDKEYIPDFIFHDDMDHTKQRLIVEVKTSPKDSIHNYRSDLNKIHEFITNYNFQQGCLIALNQETDFIKNKVRRVYLEATDELKESLKKTYLIVKEEEQFVIIKVSDL